MRPKQKIFIALASFGVFSVLFLGAVLYPIFQGVLDDHKQVLAHKTELLQLNEDKKSSGEFEAALRSYAGEFARLENLFVDSKTPIAFFRFLDETAASLSLRIEKAPGLTQHAEGNRWPSFEVRLAGKGLYPDVIAFVQKLENAPYLLEVQSLSISAGRGFAGQLESGAVEFSLSLQVFAKSL